MKHRLSGKIEFEHRVPFNLTLVMAMLLATQGITFMAGHGSVSPWVAIPLGIYDLLVVGIWLFLRHQKEIVFFKVCGLIEEVHRKHGKELSEDKLFWAARRIWYEEVKGPIVYLRQEKGHGE